MKKLLLLLLLIIPYELSGQPFVNRQPLRMPVKYSQPNFETIADYASTNILTNQNWSVWIDRTGVTTSREEKKPKFMDRFLVVEEKDRMIHIVADDATFSNSVGDFIKEPDDFGWVPKDFCVLSPNTLYSIGTKFRLKVMTITTPELMKKDMANIKNGAKKLAFYDTPTSTEPNDKETPLFEFFFILKREGSRYLVSKRNNISKGRSADFVNGWVDTSSVQLWDQRQAIEPNWDKDAANERVRLNVKSSLFSDSLDAKLFATTRNGSTAFWNDDRFSVRYTPYWKRLPVFKKSGNLVETAVVSDLVQESGDTLVKVKNDQMLGIQKMLNEQIFKSRNINLVFVIDGTQSMGPYLESVRKAVTESASAIQNSDNKFKYGAVIYRDYVNPDDDGCYMIRQLTDFSQFSRFMLTVDANQPECIDLTASEGMYLGIKKVESVLRGFEQETNIIVLIGDCGDRDGEGRLTEADVVPLIKKFNCGILAIQVHHAQDPSYEDFINQITALGRNNAEGISAILKQKYGALNLTSLSNRPRWEQENDPKRKIFNLVSSPVGGTFQYVKRGQIITAEEVQTEVKKIITNSDIKNDSLIADLRKLLEIVPEDLSKESGLTQEAIQLLLKAGFSPDEINILRKKNYQFMLRGITPLKVDSLISQVYNYVLFIDSREFDEMKITLDKIYDPGQTASKRREKLQTAWKEILRANYGVSPEEIADKNLAELMGLITGLPSLNPLLQKYRMNDLGDLNKVSESEFDDIVNDIKKKRDGLVRLSGNKDFYFLSNDMAWYWIPQNYLP